MELILLAVTAVLTTLAISYCQNIPLYSDAQRIWGEWAAWGAIALACRYQSHRTTVRSDRSDKEAQLLPIWSKPRLEKPATVLALLSVSCFCISIRFSDEKLRWTYPLATMFTSLQLYLNGHQRAWSRSFCSEPPPLQGISTTCSSSRGPINGTPAIVVLGVCLSSTIALLPPFADINRPLVMAGMVYASMVAIAYALISIVPDIENPLGAEPSATLRFADVLHPTANRAFALVTLYLAFFSVPFPTSQLLALMFACMRAVHILSVLYLCFEKSSVAATALFTASAAIMNCFSAFVISSTSTNLFVAGAALALASNSISKTAKGRLWILILLLLPLTYLLSVALTPMWSLKASQAGTTGRIHPIAQLVETNNNDFLGMLSDQSQTLEEAVTEYTRRYGRCPPPGFDKWFAVAQAKNFLLIDEFDTIMESLEPYWGVPASTLRARYESIREAPDMIEFKVRGEIVKYSREHYHASFLMNWMNYTTWGDVIPDIDFMISTLDEPRIVAPYDTVELAMQNANAQKLPGATKQDLETLHNSLRTSDSVKWINVGKQDAWEAMLSSCHVDSPARNGLVRERLTEETLSLPFVGNTTTDMDICSSTDFLHGHGFLASPESLTITHSLVPVFAQCKPSIFNDILYPSPYYQMQIDSNDYDESTDSDWDKKVDRLYWAGTATGGYSTAHNWMTMHRQRLTLTTASDSDKAVSLLKKDEQGIWQTAQSTWSKISNLFYLKITNIVQCSEEACQAMKDRFSDAGGEMKHEPIEAALGSKYALDMDGNTFSGRYYRLLKSNVAVFKHTSFNEWHDGRLIPWVHFIPVSASAEELGEMMRYLVQEEEGREIGKRIAAQGREWARKTLRGEDLEVVFVRVLMEYARVMSDDRDTMGFGLGG